MHLGLKVSLAAILIVASILASGPATATSIKNEKSSAAQCEAIAAALLSLGWNKYEGRRGAFDRAEDGFLPVCNWRSYGLVSPNNGWPLVFVNQPAFDEKRLQALP